MPNDDQTVNADLFGTIDESYVPIEEQAEEAPEMLVQMPENQEPGAQTPVQDEEVQRYQYWQSQADKAKAELAALQEYAPLIQYIRSDPEALTVLQQRAMEKNGVPQRDVLAPPVAPARPESYNDYDAYNEPDSPSYQFRVARDEYNVQLTEYLVRKDQYREEQFRIAQQQQAMEMQQRQALQQTYQMLSGQYGLNQHEALEFVQMFSDDKSINMDNLVELYRLRKGSVAQPLRQQQQKWQPVPPVAQTTMQTKNSLSDQDRFNASLGLYSWRNQK